MCIVYPNRNKLLNPGDRMRATDVQAEPAVSERGGRVAAPVCVLAAQVFRALSVRPVRGEVLPCPPLALLCCCWCLSHTYCARLRRAGGPPRTRSTCASTRCAGRRASSAGGCATPGACGRARRHAAPTSRKSLRVHTRPTIASVAARGCRAMRSRRARVHVYAKIQECWQSIACERLMCAVQACLVHFLCCCLATHVYF